LLLSIIDARERAVRRAIQTGVMSDVGLIHARQRAAGFEPCFARALAPCPHPHCRWHGECMDLMRLTTWRPGNAGPAPSEPTPESPPHMLHSAE
jgi:hypothetical protein